MRKLHMVLLGTFVTGVLLGGIGTGIAFGEYSEIEYGGKVSIGGENVVVKELDYAFTPSREERIVLTPCYRLEKNVDSLVVEDASIPVGVVRYRVSYNEKRVAPRLNFWDTEPEDGQWEDAWEEAESRALEAGREIPQKEEEPDRLAGEESAETATETAASEDAAWEGEEESAFLHEEDGEVIMPSRRLTYLELGCRFYGNDFEIIMENKDRILSDLKQKRICLYELTDIQDVEILVNPESLLYLDDHSGWN